MKILIWNIRGFNIPFKQQEVRKEVKRLNVNIICLVETRVKKDKAQNIKNAVLTGWNLIHNYDMHWLGRIWVCWDPGITSIKQLSSHEQVVTCQVDNGTNGGSWILSIVYGTSAD
jgi:exonuclease III